MKRQVSSQYRGQLRAAPAALVLSALLLLPALARAEGQIYDLSNDWVPAGPPPPSTQTDYYFMADDPVEQVVFLNFDGATLKRGQSDATNNSTSLVTGNSVDYPAMDFSRYSDKETGKAAILKEMKLLYLDFAVKFVTERPTSGQYSMVMIGGSGSGTVIAGSGSAVGVAPLDCGNNNRSDVVLVLSGRMKSAGAKDIAMVAAHELGHSFGLEHVKDPSDIMYYAKNPKTCCWTKSEIDPAHANGQCKNDPQDAKAVLAKNVGMGAGDTIKPLAWFRYPGPNAVLPPSFTFAVEAADNYLVRRVSFTVDGKDAGSIDSAPFTSFVTGLADGEHVIKATVWDANPNNKVELERTVTVQSACAKEGPCDPGLSGPGGPCASGADCETEVCALPSSGGEGVCSVGCTPSKEWNPCPTGTTCESAEGESVCAPSKTFALDRASGGCNIAAGGNPASGLAATLLPLLGLLLWARRRQG